MNRKIPHVTLTLILFANLTYGGVTGKLTGKVTDADTREPLTGANIIVEETLLGAATDENGYYVILNIPPGIYNVKASIIGYADYTVRDVRVEIDLTMTLDFQMKTEVLEGEEVIVTAEKKVIKKDVASSQRNISADRIIDLPVTSVEEVVGLQAGIEGLSVRQGGINELSMMVDGFSLKDDRTGRPISGIPLSSVQEIMIQSGGFNAEYSDLQAGVINIVTKEGNSNNYIFDFDVKYSPPAPKHFGPSVYDRDSYYLRPYLDDDVSWTGTENGAWSEHMQNQYPSFQGWIKRSEELLNDDDPKNDLTPLGAQRRFLWEHRRKGDIQKPDYDIDAGFGGPVPFIGGMLGNLRFYTSYKKDKDMYMVPLSREGYLDRTWITKLTSDITPKVKLQVSTFLKETKASTSSGIGNPSHFRDIWDVADAFGGTSQEESKIWYPEYYSRTDINTWMVSGKVAHILSQKSYYEAVFEYSKTGYHTYPGDSLNRELDNDILPGAPEFYVDDAPFGFEWKLSPSINSYMMGAKSNSRDSTKTSRLKLRFDFVSQINKNNQIKTGIQFERFTYDMNFGAINPALPVGRPWTRWKQNPYQYGVYVQDKLEFEGWIATAGLRMEYFDPNGRWYDVDPYDKTLFSKNYEESLEKEFPRKKAKGTLTFLPRLGISHPITVNSKLYFNYGHMRQKFVPDYLFGIRRVFGNQMSRLGDPELPMEKTIMYELGYDHSLLDQYLIHIAAYYKDKSDQAGRIQYESADNTVSYSQYANNVYQDVRGLELEIRKRRGEWLTGFINFTYSVYTDGHFGVRERYQNPSKQRKYTEKVSTQVQYKPLPRPKMNFNIAFHSPFRWGPTFGNQRILGGWNISLTGFWKAGAYANYGNVSGVTNNVQWKDSYNVDLRGSKSLDFKKIRIAFVFDVYNVLNLKFLSFSGLGDQYFNPTDRIDYLNSLQFPKKVYEELGEGHIAGNDRIGDYRPDGVEFQRMEFVYSSDAINNPDVIYYVDELDRWMQLNDQGELLEVGKSRIDRLSKNKAYIDNPNNSSFMFLHPRDIFFGIKLSYSL